MAGAAGKTSTAPLSTVQMQLMLAGNGGGGARAAAASIWRRGGAAAFFRGNGADVLRTVPSRALELYAYESYKRVFRQAAV